MALPTRRRVLRTINAGAATVADSLTSGAKSVVAALPTSKPTKVEKLRGVVTNRKVLIPAIVVVGLGAVGYGAYRLATSDAHLLGHYPGLSGEDLRDHSGHNDGDKQKITVADSDDAGKPKEDDFTETPSEE